GYMHFFFSSRRRHTRFSRDWSSDVCSSDLLRQSRIASVSGRLARVHTRDANLPHTSIMTDTRSIKAPVGQLRTLWPFVRRHRGRSEERRGGKECRSRWWPYRRNKKRRAREC